MNSYGMILILLPGLYFDSETLNRSLVIIEGCPKTILLRMAIIFFSQTHAGYSTCVSESSCHDRTLAGKLPTFRLAAVCWRHGSANARYAPPPRYKVVRNGIPPFPAAIRSTQVVRIAEKAAM